MATYRFVVEIETTERSDGGVRLGEDVHACIWNMFSFRRLSLTDENGDAYRAYDPESTA